MNDEQANGDTEIPINSLIKRGTSERDEEGRYWDDNYGSNEFDQDALIAFQALREDLGRQLELVSDRQNTMVQSIGIILAFASILLMEVIHSTYTNAGSIFVTASILALFACCITGIATIWEWKSWRLYTGYSSNDLSEAFNNWRFIELYHLLLTGVIV